MSDDGTMASAPSGTNDQKAQPKLYGSSGESLSSIKRPSQSQTDQIAEFVKEQPFTAALVALIIGYFIGKIT